MSKSLEKKKVTTKNKKVVNKKSEKIEKEKERKIKKLTKKQLIIIGSIFAACILVATIFISLIFFENKETNKETEKETKTSICLVQFNTNGGSEVESISFECGNILKEPETPYKSGFDFVGWYLNEEEFNFSSIVASNIILEAKWEAKKGVKTVTVKFDADGGSKQNDITIEKGTYLVKPVDPTKKGYTFIGWYLNDKEFSFTSNTISQNITLKAKWKKNNKESSNSQESFTVGSCSCTLSGALEKNEEIFLFDGNPERTNYDVYFNPLWVCSYEKEGDCESRYSSSNDEVATIDKDGNITALSEGKVSLKNCQYDKTTGKKLMCFNGTLTVKNFKSTTYDEPSIAYSDIEGRWYAEYSNVSYIEFSNHHISQNSNYQTFTYKFIGIDENTLSYSCQTGTCQQYITNTGGTIYSDYPIYRFEEMYSPKLENNRLILSINGKTVRFSRTKANVPIAAFSISKSEESVNIGKNTYVSAYIYPNNATLNEAVWSISNTSIAKITSQKHIGDTDKGSTTTAYIEALSEGTTILTATTKDGKFTEKFILTVKNGNVKVSSVELNKSSIKLAKGETFSLSATIKPSNAANKNVTWSSSDTSIATVSNNGKVTAKGNGTATITVKTDDGGYTAKCDVTVSNPTLSASGSIGVKTTVSSSGATRGVVASVKASGGTGTYTYYYIKLYKDGTLIGSTTNTSSNEIFITGYTNGSYTMEYEVRDSDGTIKKGTSSSTISGF